MTAQQLQVILFDTFVGVDERKAELPDNLLLESLPMEVAQEISARMRQSEILSALADGKQLPSYNGDVTLFKALYQEQMMVIDVMNFTRMIDENEQRWRWIVPHIHVVAVDADHYSMMTKEHIDTYIAYIHFNDETKHDESDT